MKPRGIFLTLFILVMLLDITHSQNLEKSAFKDANTIRLYVNDVSKDEAMVRFAAFINETGFEVSVPKKDETHKTDDYHEDPFKPKLVELKQSAGSSQNGDTIKTNMATLYDVMMGDYQGQLKFYPAKDKYDKIFIEVTGFVSNSHFGGDFFNLQMQKGGKGINWAQKALFKQLNKHILSYSGVDLIMYSNN